MIAHHTQGSYATFSATPLLGSRVLKLKTSVSFKLIGRNDRFNQRFSLRVHHQPILPFKEKACKISSFKGNAQNNEPESTTNGSKFSKNPAQLSYAPQEREDTIMERKVPLSYVADKRKEKMMVRSAVIQQLFKKWLIMLRTQTSRQPPEDIFGESLSQTKISEDQGVHLLQGSRSPGQVMKAAFSYFLGLDAAIKFPAMIFIPWYLVINIVYGAEVSKELMPLWVIGPVIIALYIKVVQGICALYVFSFKQAIRLVKNLPAYYLLTYNFVAKGMLNEFLRVHLWQPVADIRSLNYKELSKKKLKESQEWAVEKYLDYIESIWPNYCRTIRFLKKANLI